MKRIGTLVLVVVALLSVSVWFTPSQPGDAQDQSGERLDALESRVSDQAQDISLLQTQVSEFESAAATQKADVGQLRKRVRTLEGANSSSESESPTEVPSQSSDTVSVSGVGVQVSEAFTLESGIRYKVTATLEVTGFSGFICTLYTPNDEVNLFNELIDEPQSWSASTILTVNGSGAGEFYLSIDNTDDAWTVTFEPL